MRRVHPQRAKLPVQQTSRKPSSGGVTASNLNYESKAWTTHLDLHKRYNNSNSTAHQTLKPASLTTINTASAIATSTKPFEFNVASNLRHSQEQEANSTNLRSDGKPVLKLGVIHNSSSAGKKILADLDDEDDDDDFDLPDVDDLFADTPRKTRRIDNSSSTTQTSNTRTDHHNQTKADNQTKGKTPLRGRYLPTFSGTDKVQQYQAEQKEDDPWMMTADMLLYEEEDVGIGTFSPSSTSNHEKLAFGNNNGDNRQKQHHDQCQKLSLAKPTPSVVSETQNTLNEINGLIMNESLPRPPLPPQSPSTRHHTPFGDNEMSELRSPTPYVEAPEHLPYPRDVGESDGATTRTFGAQKDKEMDQSETVQDDREIDVEANVAGDNTQARAINEMDAALQGDQDAPIPGDHEALKALNEVSREDKNSGDQIQAPMFILPKTPAEFQGRIHGEAPCHICSYQNARVPLCPWAKLFFIV